MDHQPSQDEILNIMRSFLTCCNEMKSCKEQVDLLKSNKTFVEACEAMKACREERKALEAMIYEYMSTNDIDRAEVVTDDGQSCVSMTAKKTTVHKRLTQDYVRKTLDALQQQGAITPDVTKLLIQRLLDPNTETKGSILSRNKKQRTI